LIPARRPSSILTEAWATIPSLVSRLKSTSRRGRSGGTAVLLARRAAGLRRRLKFRTAILAGPRPRTGEGLRAGAWSLETAGTAGAASTRLARGKAGAGAITAGFQVRAAASFSGQHFGGLDPLRFPLALGGQAQQVQLLRIKFAHISRLDVEHQRPIPDAANLLHVMADLLKHLAQLAIAALDQGDFKPRIFALAHLLNPGRRGVNASFAGLAAINA
jgi:hypothetical protein